MQKTHHRILAFAILLAMSGCSLVDSAKGLISKEEKKQPAKSQWVTKNQYDQLNEKYIKAKNELSELQKHKAYNQVSELVDHSVKEKAKSWEPTINIEAPVKTSPKIIKKVNRSEKSVIFSQYAKALALFNNQKFTQALPLFQSLETSDNRQVAVRSLYYIGLIYKKLNQHDLSLQVFDSIISKHSFSYIVLDSLKEAISSARTLGLNDKVGRYQSILQDFFGIKA